MTKKDLISLAIKGCALYLLVKAVETAGFAILAVTSLAMQQISPAYMLSVIVGGLLCTVIFLAPGAFALIKSDKLAARIVPGDAGAAVIASISAQEAKTILLLFAGVLIAASGATALPRLIAEFMQRAPGAVIDGAEIALKLVVGGGLIIWARKQ